MKIRSNLVNPMSVNELNIKNEIPCSILNPITILTQEEYDLIQLKDSTIMYVISNSNDNRYYVGDMLIINDSIKSTYLIGPGDIYGEYTLYVNMKTRLYDKLVPISKYDNAQKAINELNRCSKVGLHTNLALQIYNIFNRFIDNDLSINETILGIISLFGFRDDIRLQEVIQITIINKANVSHKDIPSYFKQELVKLRISKNPLFKFYSDLYNLISLYNFFKGKEFQKINDEELNLSEIINKVYDIMLNHKD